MKREKPLATITERWGALDADLCLALVKWYNTRPRVTFDINDAHRELLLGLVESGRFWFWNCPVCGEQCTHGDPDDWSHFQGVKGQDYMSYPGDSEVFTTEALVAMCNNCRMNCAGMPAESKYPPVDACLDH